LLALSVVAVVEVCADATPVINAVLNNAIAIYLDFHGVLHCEPQQHGLFGFGSIGWKKVSNLAI
jgi:hypothetical protein